MEITNNPNGTTTLTVDATEARILATGLMRMQSRLINGAGDPVSIDRDMEALQHNLRRELALSRIWPFWSSFINDQGFVIVPPGVSLSCEYDGLAPPVNSEWPYSEECPFDYPEDVNVG